MTETPPITPTQYAKAAALVGIVLVSISVLGFGLLILWPAEGDRPFDSAVWKENTNTLEMNIRTSMRKDLAARIKTERWQRSRVQFELGEGELLADGRMLVYPLGRRRGAWPFRHFGFLTSFDTWRLRVYFDENGVAVGAE